MCWGGFRGLKSSTLGLFQFLSDLRRAILMFASGGFLIPLEQAKSCRIPCFVTCHVIISLYPGRLKSSNT